MADRDDKGRFVKGNKASPGRLPAAREYRYYDILMTEVTLKDWKAIVSKAGDQARRGDATARKWLSDYLLGPPKQKLDITSTQEDINVVLYLPRNGREEDDNG